MKIKCTIKSSNVLTLGKEYTVYELGHFYASNFNLGLEVQVSIVADDGYLTMEPLKSFEITDGRWSDYWVLSRIKRPVQNKDKTGFIISCSPKGFDMRDLFDLAYDEEEKYLDTPINKAKLEKLKNMMENEFE
jgi:hypothetical protein